MVAPANGLLRLTRAVAFASVAVVVSLIGHVAAGGPSPGAATVLALAAVCVLPAIWLTRTRRRFSSLVAALGAGELGLHHAFMALSGHGSCHAVGSGHHAMTVSCDGMPAMVASAAGDHLTHTMFLAHAAATVALAALLAHGERVVWELRAWLLAVVPGRPGTPAAPTLRRARGHAATWVFPLRWRAESGCVSRRGPPDAVTVPA